MEAQNASLPAFRRLLLDAFSAEPVRFVTINFERKTLRQIGDGHHSPIGAYDAHSDRVLVLDVARPLAV